jgi:N-acetylmuramoyl-L-alanine amidase
VQRRLIAHGAAVDRAELGQYGPTTAEAVRAFQHERGLLVTGNCDQTTWQALVEAGYRLGDRLLYLRSPMLRGDDVHDLQRGLGALGFDAGRVDGIFGPQTEGALRQFQRNAGLTTDGVCGPEVRAALARLGGRTGSPSVAGVRERERLRSVPPHLTDRRVAIGQPGGLDGLAASIGRLLHEAGATVAVLHHPEASAQAREANAFQADVYVGLDLADQDRSRIAFYETSGFRSVGGARLSQLLFEHLPATGGIRCHEPLGLRLPVLRETRMPAVVVLLGPPALVVERTAQLASAVVEAVSAWVTSPIET